MQPNPVNAQPDSEKVIRSLVAHGAPLLGWAFRISFLLAVEQMFGKPAADTGGPNL